MPISYLHNDPDIKGEVCPSCGKKSWSIYKCDVCGKIFCKHCRPDLVNLLDDDRFGDLEVSCDCGSATLFLDE